MSLPLKNTPAQIIWSLLKGTSSIVLPVFISSEPSIPDNVITVLDTAEKYDGRDNLSGEIITHYGLSIRVRAINHNLGYMQSQALRKLLGATYYANTVTLGAYSYIVSCFSRITIVTSGRDRPRSERSLFVVNCFVAIRRTA